MILGFFFGPSDSESELDPLLSEGSDMRSKVRVCFEGFDFCSGLSFPVSGVDLGKGSLEFLKEGFRRPDLASDASISAL